MRVVSPAVVVGLLVAVAGAIGAWYLINSYSQEEQFLAAARDLPSGHVVAEGDLVAVAARLAPAQASQAWPVSSASAIVGNWLAEPVRGGQLLARTAFVAVAEPEPGEVEIVVSADDDDLPRDAGRGDCVRIRQVVEAGPGGGAVRDIVEPRILDAQRDGGSLDRIVIPVRSGSGAASALHAASYSGGLAFELLPSCGAAGEDEDAAS